MHNYSQSIAVQTWIYTHPAKAAIIVIWSLFWMGLALWHSGRRGNFIWFFVFLLVHTLGILEIIYLFGVLRLKVSDLFKK